MRKVLFSLASVILLALVALGIWKFLAQPGGDEPVAASASTTESSTWPNNSDLETSSQAPQEQLQLIESAFATGDSAEVATLVGLSADQLDEQFLATVHAMELKIDRDSLAEVETGIWVVEAVDRSGNEWDIAYRIDAGQPILLGTKYKGTEK